MAVVGGLFCGPVTDGIGGRLRFIIDSLTTLAVVQLVIANAPSWLWLIQFHALPGVAMGAYQVNSLALMADILHEHPNRGQSVSAHRMSGSLALNR